MSSTKKDFPEKKENTNANSSKVKTENRSFKRQEKKTETPRKIHNNKPASALENFSTSSSPEKEETTKPRYCKFCESQGHSMFGCTTCETHESRVKRCDGLKICHLCSSNKHLAPQCLGRFKKMSFLCSSCNAKTHISALCPSRSETSTNICINVQHSMKNFQPLFLPVLSFTFFW